MNFALILTLGNNSVTSIPFQTKELADIAGDYWVMSSNEHINTRSYVVVKTKFSTNEES